MVHLTESAAAMSLFRISFGRQRFHNLPHDLPCLQHLLFKKRFSNVSLEWFCNFHPLLLVLSTLGTENRLLFFATPFHDLKTYCIWPDFCSLEWRTTFLLNWRQYFIIRNGFFSAFLLPIFPHNTTFVIPVIAPTLIGLLLLLPISFFPSTFPFSENNSVEEKTQGIQKSKA